jgi:spore maturation protein CgeB
MTDSNLIPSFQIDGRQASSSAVASLSVSGTPDNFLEHNLSLLRQRFPRAAGLIIEALNATSNVSIQESLEGPVLSIDGQCLDHATKPRSAGEIWADRGLSDPKIADAEVVLIYGFGAGYHVESLIKKTKARVVVIEPSVQTMIAALKVRELTSVISALADLCVGESFLPDNMPDRIELLVRPQTQAINPSHLTKVKSFTYERRGFAILKPKIAVVGPIMGGTLPIMEYCSRGFAHLNQITRQLDMSGFCGGFNEIRKVLRNDQCRTVVENNYAQMLSTLILESVREYPVDIVVCMAQAPLTGAALQELRRRGIITVLWFVEDYLRFTYWREMSKYYDFIFTIQQGECLELIRQAGAGEVHYLPMAADPAIHRPLSLTPEQKARWGSPLSFVGAGYYNRQQVFASFAELPMKIWGTEWPDCKPFTELVQERGRRLTPEEYIKIFNATDININLHSSTERGDVDPGGDFVNPRTFELASCGAFQLVDERSLLPEVFESGKELVTFKDSKDLKEKISHYMNKPTERAQIGAAARARVLRDHTYEARLKQMLSIIYGSKFETLNNRQLSSPWHAMIRRTEKYPELQARCKAAHARGEMPKLDGLVADVITGQGKLTETEQKLLFLHHLTSQIVMMKREEKKA